MSKDKNTESKELTGLNTDITVIDTIEEATPVEEKPTTKKKSKKTFAYVTSPIAYLRADADEDGSIIGIIRQGDAMLLAHDSKINGFYYGTINNTLGYVAANQMEIR